MPKRGIASVALVALMGAACGGGGGGEQTTDSFKQEDAQQQALEYAECMRDHGIDMPDPQIDENGVMEIQIGGDAQDIDSDKMAEAQEACQDLLPEMEEPSEEEKAKIEDAMLEFAECMREHGIDIPDPSENDGGMTISGGEKGIESAVDFDDPDFQAAQEACQDLLPNAAVRR